MTELPNRQLTFVDDISRWRPLPPTSSQRRLVLSDDQGIADATISRYRDYLGHEFFQVTIDCRQQQHLDAIAALTGTIIAGGELILLMPQHDSPLCTHLRRCAQHAFADATRAPQADAVALTPLPTAEQQALQQQLADSHSVHLITADRGRGKSSCLGAAVAHLESTGSQQRVLVTAPRRANVANLLRQAPNVQFVAWDKLLQQQQADALLVIDEAAGIPLWALQRLCTLFQPWLLATTVHGYEGCGRGFAIHFNDWLQQHFPNLQQHRLTRPLRWPEDDPLEHWLAEALLMHTPTTSAAAIDEGCYHFSELAPQHQFQVFELLLEAHYQSSPNDLGLLLDDNQQKLLISVRQQHIVAVAWLSLEGPLDDALATQIVAGTRRPKGNLLPQALGYFLQQPQALQHRWCRVVRIAVAEPWRRQQVGSELLARAQTWAQQQGCYALGSSFGYHPTLVTFWQTNGFHFARISTATDRVSARHPTIMLKPLADDDAWFRNVLDYGAAEVAWLCHGNIEDSSPSPIIDTIINAFTQQRLALASAHYALTYCTELPSSIRQLLQCTPLAVTALQRQLNLDSRRQLERQLRQLIKGEQSDGPH